MKTIAIIGARLNSSRLPGKHLLPLANKPLIERLLQRLQHCKNLDDIVLATTNDSFNEPLINWANNRVKCYVHNGDVDDLMGRVDAVVNVYSPKIIIYICGDCPLIDPVFIDNGIKALINNQQAETIALSPTIKSIHEGIHFYSQNGWNKLIQNSTNTIEREHVGYVDSKQHILKKHYIEDSANYSTVNQRISVDTQADYDFMSELYSMWYKKQPNESIIQLDWVVAQLKKNDNLSEFNAHVIQKCPEKAYQDISLYCHVSKKIGMGHLRRCVLIANSIKESYGLNTHIHIQGDFKEIPWLNGKVSWHPSQDSIFKTMNIDSSVVCFFDFHPDHISISRLITTCKSIKINSDTRIIAIDKLNCLLDYVDKLFIPSFYSSLTSTKVSFGWENYILPPIKKKKKKHQVTILTGGSDALNYGKTLPFLLEESIPDNWEINWVQGPYAKKPKIPNNLTRWKLHYNPSNLQEIILSSKVIITCYGLSLIESLRSNATTMLLPVNNLCDDNELSSLKSLKCCFIADRNEDIPILLNKIFTDKELVSIYHENAIKLVDKIRGAEILGSIINEYLKSRCFP